LGRLPSIRSFLTCPARSPPLGSSVFQCSLPTRHQCRHSRPDRSPSHHGGTSDGSAVFGLVDLIRRRTGLTSGRGGDRPRPLTHLGGACPSRKSSLLGRGSEKSGAQQEQRIVVLRLRRALSRARFLEACNPSLHFPALSALPAMHPAFTSSFSGVPVLAPITDPSSASVAIERLLPQRHSARRSFAG
jgi:hypothetical protein